MAGTSEIQADWRAFYPFASQWAEVPGGRMHYLDERPASLSNGTDAPTLLFVHGNPTWSFHWRRLIEALRTRYRCIAVDHIGCGLSEKPARLQTLQEHIENLQALVISLNLEHVTLVAQDWGGAIGLGTMLRAPERLDQIVLYNTGAWPPRYIPWRIRACRIPLLGQLAVQGGNLFSRAALRMTLSRRRKLDDAVAAGYLAPYDNWHNRRAVYGFVRDIPTSPSEPTWQTLAAIERDLPTLANRPAALIWGMRDWCFRPDCLETFAAAWPQAKQRRVADVGHWIVEDAPDESLEILESFLGESEKHLPQRHEEHEVGKKT